MDISKLKHFISVYETNHVRNAAELLGMTPGALSKSLATLEQSLGFKLFNASGRGILPTDRAHKLYQESKDLVERFDQLIENLDETKVKTEKPLRIASWEIFTTYFLAKMSEEIFKDRKIRVLEKGPQDVELAVLKNEADFGITYAPFPDPNLDHIPICSVRYGLFGNAKLIKNKKIEDLPFSVPITRFTGSPTGVKTLDNWPPEIPRQIKYEFEMLETGLETARRGMSVLFCSSFLIPLMNESLKPAHQLTEVRIPKKVKRDIYIVKQKHREEDADMKKLARALRTYCNPGKN